MSKDETIDSLTAERDDAVRGMTSALRLVCDLRWALGDRGGRMQPELIEFARQMRKDAERYRWLKAHPLWSVTYRVKTRKGGEPYKEWRMHDGEERWGNWWPTHEQAVDHAMVLHNA